MRYLLRIYFLRSPSCSMSCRAPTLAKDTAGSGPHACSEKIVYIVFSNYIKLRYIELPSFKIRYQKRKVVTSSLTVCLHLRNIAMFRCFFLKTILLNIATQSVSLISKEIDSQSLLRFGQGSSHSLPVTRQKLQLRATWAGQVGLYKSCMLIYFTE